MSQRSVEFESLEDARYLFVQSKIINGATHPLTLSAGTAVDYWFDKWCEKGSSGKVGEGKLDLAEKIAEALHHIVVDQQHGGGE